MAKRVLVVSPHCDDAALSCCDHIFAWQKQGLRIDVLTVFDRYPDAGAHSGDAKAMIADSGLASASAYGRIRNAEDISALRAMGVERLSGGLSDALFRLSGHTPVYASYGQVASGVIAPGDKHTVASVKNMIGEMAGSYSRVVGPCGLGGHADHIIVRDALLELEHEDTRYYFDFPYWVHERKALPLLSRTLGVTLASKRKKAILALYPSQLGMLLDTVPPIIHPFLPEITVARPG